MKLQVGKVYNSNSEGTWYIQCKLERSFSGGSAGQYFAVPAGWPNPGYMIYNEDGTPRRTMHSSSTMSDAFTLKPNTVKKEAWVNIYKEGSLGQAWSSKQKADEQDSAGRRVACIKIQWEEETE